MSQLIFKRVIVMLTLVAAAGLAQADPSSDPMPDWQDRGEHGWDGGNGPYDRSQPGSGPTRFVSEFTRLIDSGVLKPATLRDLQDQERRAFWKDLEHRKIIEEFIVQHPDLPRVRELLELRPTNPAVDRTVDGNHRTLVTFPNGFAETIQTNGESTKLAQLSHSTSNAGIGRRLLHHQE